MQRKTKQATITTNKKNYSQNSTSKRCVIVIAKTSVLWGILESNYRFFCVAVFVREITFNNNNNKW